METSNSGLIERLLQHKPILICIALLILFWILSKKWFKSEQYSVILDSEYSSTSTNTNTYTNQDVIFLTKEQASQFLNDNSDQFATQFNSLNLYASGRQSIPDLLSKWSSSTDSFSNEEKEKCKQAISIVKQTIQQKIKDHQFKNQLQSIRWQLGKTIYPYYCDGLPHTREDIIWLSDKTLTHSSVRRLARLMLHELIHIWERFFSQDMDRWMEKQGFKVVGYIKDDPLYRCNPDVNDKKYQNKEGTTLYARYKNQTPSSLMDVDFLNGQSNLEHPYEQLAYKMEQLVDV